MLRARRHYEVLDSGGRAVYVATNASTLGGGALTEIVLVQDLIVPQRYRLEYSIDAEGHVLCEFATADRKLYLRVKYQDAPANAKPEPPRDSSYRDRSEVEYSTPGYRYAMRGEQWASPLSRARISELRLAIDPTLLEAIERMREFVDTVADANLFWHAMLRDILHGSCVDRSLAHARVQEPDCAFDKSFDLPCSEESLARIAHARAEGRAPERY